MISLNGPITALDIKDKTAFFGKFTEAPGYISETTYII